jgi:hypothetical protein
MGNMLGERRFVIISPPPVGEAAEGRWGEWNDMREPKAFITKARELRKEMSLPERVLWAALRALSSTA